MSKNLTLDIGSSSCKLCLTEKNFNNIEILFYAEKKYANPVRDNLSDEMIEVISNQLKNLIRDFNDVDKEIIDCNISFGGTNVSSVIIESSIENIDKNSIISQDQLNLLSKNNPKINSFTTKKTAHIIPLDYNLDGMIGIRHPLGMHSSKLSVQNLYVNIENDHFEKIIKIISESGLNCNYITSDIISSSLYLLNSDEREIGSLIIDIGASSTSYCISKKGNPVMTGALPVGGSQFSSDLSIAFSTNIDFANQLKFETSCTPENERIAEKVIVKDKDSSKTFEITKRQISQVLKERAVEIFTLIRQDIMKN
jgi:Actin-like ATPase involved in cell division